MRLGLLSLAALASIVFPSLAHADTLSIYVNGGSIGVIQLPSTPTVYVENEYLEYADVPAYSAGSGNTTTNVFFINPAYAESMGDGDIDLQVNETLFTGPQLYAGDESAGDLLIGDFTLGAPADEDPGNDVITADITAATPEPSSLVLLSTGILAAAGAARRRFRS